MKNSEWVQLQAFMFFVSVLVPWHFRRRLGFVLTLAWAYALAAAVWTGFQPNFVIMGLPDSLGPLIEANGARQFITLLIFPALFLSLPIRFFPGILLAQCVLLLVDSYFVLSVPNSSGIGFTLVTSTFITGLCSVFLPYLLETRRFILAGLLTAFIFLVWHGSTGIAGVAVGVGLYLLLKKNWRALVPLILIGLGFLALRWKTVLNATGRPEIWGNYLSLFFEKANPFFGFGAGSISPLGIWFTVDGFSYRHVHNDFLEILLETGFVGFSLAVLSWAQILFWARKQAWLLSSLAAMTVVGLTYHPTRYVFSLVTVLILSRLSLEKGPSNTMLNGPGKSSVI